MKILNVEVEFDFLDADNMEKFEEEARKVKEQCEMKGKENMSYSQVIREECNIIDNFFNNVFGQGIADKIFNGKKNLNEHIKAFEDIINYKVELQNKLESTLNRYQPNRQQRRFNYYKGNKR